MNRITLRSLKECKAKKKQKQKQANKQTKTKIKTKQKETSIATVWKPFFCFRIKLSDLLPINCKVVANSSWTIHKCNIL
jgi:hypothetical protein